MLKPISLALCLAGCAMPILAADTDSRLLVEMSPGARAALRAEMLDFQSALHAIIAALAEGKFSDAATAAEKQIGLSAMGRHRTAPMDERPGRYMPNDMHAIALNMHAAASEFAKEAKSGDTAKALISLQNVTGACVACHRAYRIQ